MILVLLYKKFEDIEFRKEEIMVHDKVREHIRRMEVRQGWLARRMGVSEGALSLMLTGKRRMTADELERLCAILCVSPEMFVKPEELDLKV